MSQGIGNVYCIGRNYGKHAAELGNAVPEEPLVFMKPTHALVPMDGRTISLPADCGEVHYEAELVVSIAEDVEPGVPEHRYIGGYALGIDFTLRDVQSVIKKQGYPWLAAKGVLNSAPLSPWQPFEGMDQLTSTPFALHVNGEIRQQGTAVEMIFTIPTLAAYIARHYGLRKGDLIFTGTPSGVGPVRHGDTLELCWAGQAIGSIGIHMG